MVLMGHKLWQKDRNFQLSIDFKELTMSIDFKELHSANFWIRLVLGIHSDPKCQIYIQNEFVRVD